MFISLFLVGQLLAGAEGQSCDSFRSNQICSTRAANLVGEIQGIEEPADCQAECGAAEECNYFTWVRFLGSLGYPSSCILFRSCDTPEDCGQECEYSLLGPEAPAYPTVCCDEFRPGQVCDGNIGNIIEALVDVPDIINCQGLCQEVTLCRYFLYDESTMRCFLLKDCNSKTSCDSCWSGPQFPSYSSCQEPTNSTTTTAGPSNTTITTTTTAAPTQASTALLMGGYKAGQKTESWPCDLNIPDIPREVFIPGAAVLGSKVFLCGGFNGGTVYYAACHVLENGAWSSGPQMTSQRRMFTLNTVGDVLVAAGGHNGIQLQTVEIYTEAQGRWQTASWKLSASRQEHCAVTLSDTEIIVAGGRGPSGTSGLVEKYNVQTGAMVTLTPLTTPREDLSCTLDEATNSLIVIGGYSTAYLAMVERLDLSSQTWSTLTPLNTARVYHSTGILNGALTVFGGETTGAVALDTIEVLNGTAWTTVWMKTARNAHAMVQLPCPDY